MENVSRVLTRIETIEQRLGVHREGGFDVVFDRAVAAGRSSGTSGLATPSAGGFGAIFTGSGMLPVAAPPASPVMTSAELTDYLVTSGITDRNGHLGSAELTAVSGAFDDRPARLLPPAAAAWESMREAAARDGVDLRVIDTYRSWDAQADGRDRYLRGEKDAYVAPPGESRHGEGLAVDVTNGGLVGPGSVEWAWMRDHAESFGWAPIPNESWHWEFRGRG